MGNTEKRAARGGKNILLWYTINKEYRLCRAAGYVSGQSAPGRRQVPAHLVME